MIAIGNTAVGNTIAIGNTAYHQIAVGQQNSITVVHKPEDEYFNEFEKLILQYPNKWKSWNWKDLTKNKYITYKFIFAHLELPWDWEYITNQSKPDIIFNNLDLPWDWDYVLPRTLDDLLIYKNIPWNWNWISQRSKLNWEFIIDHPELPWLWDRFHYNIHLIITLKIVKENMDKNWDTNYLAGVDFKEQDYRYLMTLKNINFLANEKLPKYLAMEIFKDECQMLSLYELSTIL